MDSAEIIGQLDAAADEAVFPELNNGYYYAVDARLHAYRDARRWALIVETVGYSPRAGNLTDVLHVFGNCLTGGEPGFENGDFLDRIDNWDEIEDADEPETFRGTPIVIRGRRLETAAEVGDDLVDVFRRLAPEHRELLLADEAELRRRIPADLPEIMRLDAWHHPVDELPSESTTFRQLADVLATGDRERYAPDMPPNTHWSHWPESGTL
ncbi:hypothetical protein GCM10010168_27470 [Actinoplanes ianthinogenes]|uniref:Uncharacterized protein n=1 Tax=Actinoplanes ianthinogenes TaxID=122358 RepID=A0ABN6C5N1_9ACTN|nr:hypothetical protein [Actinoplanes ianthinogenes]BCJ39888.1 hypothetical protein Aiant_05450 [Actinoplanes ianthinogenes]GGR08802.1 hypothetical protein GCM10010168_27470 [Actinoplanes ianthinogenes]